MKRKINLFYIIITFVFFLLTFYEVGVYLKINSNLLGLIYLFFNFFISFILFTLTYNYRKGNVKIRFSKNIVAIVLGLFASYILGFLIPTLISYVDESYLFTDGVFLVSKIFKPILYLLLVGVSVFEIKFMKKL